MIQSLECPGFSTQPASCPLGCLYSVAWLTTVGYFWQISDIHLDLDYTTYGDEDNMCHMSNEESKNTSENLSETNKIGRYGNVRCDSPWALADFTIGAMEKIAAKPDFILWTGDALVHPSKKTVSKSWTKVYETHQILSRRLRKSFPFVKILPILGNHDSHPPNILPAGKSQIYQGYLEKGGWNILLPRSTWSTFISGGYYSIYVRPHLQVVGLNTMLWTSRNKILADLEDPAGQFEWLEGILNKAEKNGDKVYLVGHMPPGFYIRALTGIANKAEYYNKFSVRYIELVVRYQDVIMSQMFGHQHVDSFLLVRDENGNIVNSILLCPSVTPWYEAHPRDPGFYQPVNPSVRLFTFNRDNGIVQNYQQYFLNLTKANEEGKEPEWEFLYSFASSYGLPDITHASLQKLYEMLEKDGNVFNDFYNYTTAAKHLILCDEFCKMAILCSVSYISLSEYHNCMNNTVNLE